jgi:hypothetical protein
MTGQYDFTNQDWQHVAMTPVLVGWAVARAEDSGFYGSIKEARTLVSTIAAGAEQNPAGSLIAQAAATDTDELTSAFRATAPDALAGAAVNACRELVRILAVTVQPDEATGYARWVLSVANTVAEAAKEDGVRVSAGEADLIDRLQAALGIDP